MTTTIRPTGPAEPAPGGAGGTTRAYAICVNSRPVGGIRISTRPRPGGVRGELEELSVEPEARRRGRATTAVLAAEEVLRGLGCTEVMAGVPTAELDPDADPEAALALAETLGYRPASRRMAKTVPPAGELPPLGAGRTARPLSPGEFPGWLDRSVDGTAELLAANGAPGIERARESARASFTGLLPDGTATPDAALRILEQDGEPVASLWLAATERPAAEGGGRRAWIYHVEALAGHRGRGHGRAALHLAEHEARAAGLDEIALNVHESNEPARGLYTSLGYRTIQHWLLKPLP